MDHPNLEVFLIQIKHELLRNPGKSRTYSNLTKEEWEARKTFTDDRSMMNYFSGIVDRRKVFSLISTRNIVRLLHHPDNPTRRRIC